MTVSSILVLAAMTALGPSGQGLPVGGAQHRPSAIVTALNDTGFDALRHTATGKAAGDNVVLSPLSIHTCLAACLVGAGPSAAPGLAGALHLSPTSPQALPGDVRMLLLSLILGGEGSVTHRSALWTSGGSRRDVQQTLLSFGADLMVLPRDPSATVRAVNEWVKAATKERIPKVIDQVSNETTFVVASACTFDGEWPLPLTVLTGDSALEFKPVGSDPYRPPTLAQSGAFSYARTPEVEAVLLPYKVWRYGLLLIKPVGDRPLGPVIDRMTADRLLALRREMSSKPGDVIFPKFTIRSTLDLPAFLKGRGAGVAFERGNRFPGFGQDSFLQQVVHSALIEVDEKGTRAAAATVASGGGLGGGSSKPPEERFRFVADRPFLFVVYDQVTGAVLFSGVCRKP